MENSIQSARRVDSARRIARMWEISKNSEGLFVHGAELRGASSDLIVYARKLMKLEQQLQVTLNS
jgi:hypothetical protein